MIILTLTVVENHRKVRKEPQNFLFCGSFDINDYFIFIKRTKFPIAIYPKGKYINNNVSLCHNPSFLINVSWNCGLSAIMKKAKKIQAKTKIIMKSIPAILSLPLYVSIDKNNGTNNNAINPNAAPIPCIFDDTVIISLLSFTLKTPDNIPTPTANIIIRITVVMVSDWEISQYF